MTARSQLWVYNSENCFVGFFYQFTCCVKRAKQLNEKPDFGTGYCPTLLYDIVDGNQSQGSTELNSTFTKACSHQRHLNTSMNCVVGTGLLQASPIGLNWFPLVTVSSLFWVKQCPREEGPDGSFWSQRGCWWVGVRRDDGQTEQGRRSSCCTKGDGRLKGEEASPQFGLKHVVGNYYLGSTGNEKLRQLALISAISWKHTALPPVHTDLTMSAAHPSNDNVK